jgi:hypothetical protein
MKMTVGVEWAVFGLETPTILGALEPTGTQVHNGQRCRLRKAFSGDGLETVLAGGEDLP